MPRNIIIMLISFALLMGCTPKIDQKKHENLHHAAKAIPGATAVGVSYEKLGELLQSLSTEILIANDKSKSDLEKELLKGYADVLMMYHESTIVWKHKIEGARYDWVPRRQICIEEELRPIISKYSLPTEQHATKYGLKFDTISEDSIQIIWGKANEHLEKTTKLYLGQ